MPPDPVRQAFHQQAEWCTALGSPFTAALMRLCATRLDRTTPTGARILDWSTRPGARPGAHPDSRADALPLRFAGGLHALAAAGTLPALAAAYPPNPTPPDDALWAAVQSALHAPGDPLLPWLDSAPQTNEVARSAILMPGLMLYAHETNLPIHLLELGSSAGLNLLLDRYAYDLGGTPAGTPSSPLRLAPEWRGPPPPPANPRIVARRGVDLAPIDGTEPAARARLLAYVWADQADRLARIRTALDLAAADPPRIDRADAAEWLERTLPLEAEPGTARVVMHSIAAQYFPAATSARLAAHLAAAGARATPTTPLAWLRFEVDPTVGERPALRLTTWPGAQDRLLATASAHGHWIEWRGPA